MSVSRRSALCSVLETLALATGILLFAGPPLRAEQPGQPQGTGQQGSGLAAKDPGRPESVCEPSLLDSPYIPVDSWVYPAVWRLYSLGFIDTVYLGMRPYTRSSLDHMLEDAGAKIEDADPGPATDEA